MNEIKTYFESGTGWADIECLLSYEKFELTDLEKIVKHALSLGLVFEEGEFSPMPNVSPFGAFTIDDKEIDPPAFTPFSKFIDLIAKEQCNVVNILFKGILFDVDTEIIFSFFMQGKVLIIYCLENFFWGYGDNIKLADVRRLQALYKLCYAICNILPPKYAHIGGECHSIDIQVENAEANGFKLYDPEIFSDKNAQELMDWYIKTYVDDLDKRLQEYGLSIDDFEEWCSKQTK